MLEVVSKDHPERDLIQKRNDYAQAKIPEYWIVNPLTETILVFRLKGKRFQQAGHYARARWLLERHTLTSHSTSVDAPASRIPAPR